MLARLLTAAVVLVAGAPPLARAQERTRVPVLTQAGGTPRRLLLEAFVYRPAGPGPHRVVVISHGSAGGAPKRPIPAAGLAAYFVRRGMLVLVPMRRGRGASEGESLESEARNCDPRSWEPGLAAALEDLTGAIDYARALPDADPRPVLLVGVSRGGFLSVAYAAEGPRRAAVAGVVNFVGAWVAQREDRCPRDYNALAFARFGREARAPMLWLYGDRDPYNATPDVEAYARGFAAGGGAARFVLVRDVPGDGHALPGYPRLWGDRVDGFLRAIGELAR